MKHSSTSTTSAYESRLVRSSHSVQRVRNRVLSHSIALLAGSVALLGFAGSTSAGAASKKAFPVTVKTGATSVTIKKQPVRIVSLSPTATEMLFAIGAGKQVKAADDYSNFPANAPKTKLSGFKPNVEAIVAYKPDLVVASADGDAMKALRALKIPVMVLPAAEKITDSYAQIEQLGAATGHIADAVKVSSTMQADIAAIVASVPKRTAPLRYFHELDNTLYSVTSKTFVGQLYSLLGMTNVADAADKDGFGYPQLSAEYLVSIDPDVILLADTKCCAQDAAAVAKRAGFSGLSAVKSGQIIALDDDVASRWGPRIVDLLRVLATSTASLKGTAAPVGVGA
jgi:iron complex transport system substrate-binding protein